MADRYWVGGTDTWDATAGTKWATTSGGAGGAAVPTAADDVFIDANSGVGTLTVTATTGVAVCRSLDCTGASLGTLALNGSDISIGDASGGALTMSASLNVTGVTNSHFIFKATSTNGGTGWPITSAGTPMPFLTFQGAGGMWTLQDNVSRTRHRYYFRNLQRQRQDYHMPGFHIE